MSIGKRREKLFQKIKNSQKDVKFKDLDKLLGWFGCECDPPNGGSHYTYIYEDKMLTVPKPHGGKNEVKIDYIKQAIKFIEDIKEKVEELENDDDKNERKQN